MAAVLLPTAEELLQISDLPGLRSWAGLGEQAWNAASVQLGLVSDLHGFAAVPKETLDKALPSVLVYPRSPAEPQGGRALTAVERAQIELMWMVAKQRVVTLPVPTPPGPAAALEGEAAGEAGPAAGRGGAQDPEDGRPDPKRRPKAEVEGELAAAMEAGDPGQLQRACSMARAAGFASLTRPAAELLGRIVSARDEERSRSEALRELRAAGSGDVDVTRLRHAIVRAWHTGVAEADTEAATVLWRIAGQRRREAELAFQQAMESRDLEELRAVIAELEKVGLKAEAIVAGDMLEEEEEQAKHHEEVAGTVEEE